MTTMPDNETRIFTGTHGDYCWLASTEQYMGDLVRFCPDLVLNRYLVVTRIDSGTPWLTGKQRERGWRLQLGMAYSPPIATVEELFYQRDGLDAPGFDEWYVFDEPRDLGGILEGNPFLPENAPKPGRLLAFVGWLGFAPGSADPVFQRVQEMFWRQMEWVQPDLYISDGNESLNVVCKDRDLLNSIHRRLSEALAG
jgi:hypothetical protein